MESQFFEMYIMASSLFVSSIIAIYLKWSVCARWIWWYAMQVRWVCVHLQCTRYSSSSFHPCIILNRHIKCNYKMSISVSILVGRFLLSALLLLQFTFTKDKQFAAWLFYLIVYMCICQNFLRANTHTPTHLGYMQSENEFVIHLTQNLFKLFFCSIENAVQPHTHMPSAHIHDY